VGVTGSTGRYVSPLRYPGGKGKVANFVKLLMLENDLVGRDYVEPYAGGASVALALLFEDYAGHIHINDINPGVHAFWDAVLHATDELCRRIETVPVTVEEWHRQRDVHRDPTTTGLELGFATFFLNRTNRSGIISGGVIGGLDQKGLWKIDARYNAAKLVRRIRKVRRFRSRITLTRLDAADLLRQWTDARAQHDAFFYLDPPYYVKGGDLYDNFYGHEDHKTIASLVQRVPHPWLVTYDAAPEVIAMYGARDLHRYGLHYSAAKRVRGSEVIFTSSGLVLPQDRPAGVSVATVERARLPALPSGI
jgi:DNA adenine methylase